MAARRSVRSHNLAGALTAHKPTDAEKLQELLEHFFDAFDEHNWTALQMMLSEELLVDYSSLRGGEPGLKPITAAEYVGQRARTLGNLVTAHEFSGLEGNIDKDTATGRCAFSIQRFSADGLRHFHTTGEYDFVFLRTGDNWLIKAITQNTMTRDGDPDLHAG
jgi:hypothetical protein